MPIYEITEDRFAPIEATSFEKAKLKERGDLQRLLRSQIDVVSPNTLVIAEEFGEWDESKRRLAFDSIIEAYLRRHRPICGTLLRLPDEVSFAQESKEKAEEQQEHASQAGSRRVERHLPAGGTRGFGAFAGHRSRGSLPSHSQRQEQSRRGIGQADA